MTCIELFDINFSDNICSCLAFSPERVILLGKEKKISKHAERYSRLFKERGCDTEFIPILLDRRDMKKIISTLSKIVEEYENCTFDLTGGDDIYLVAVGIVLERYKGKVQAHCISARSGEIIDCDCDGKVSERLQMPYLTFPENVSLYGGIVRKDSSAPCWDFTDEFNSDLEKMWEILLKNPKSWNNQTWYISAFTTRTSAGDELEIKCAVKDIRKFKQNSNRDEDFDVEFLKKLHNAGVITNCYCTDKELHFRFKNDQIKQCLTKSGQVLELKIYNVAKKIKTDGVPFYNDVLTGVIIDWEEKGQSSPDHIINEIDVVMMKGMVPVLVSCKNGRFESGEIYKLASVTSKFGGKYAKKIIVTTSKECADIMRARASELGVGIVYIPNSITPEKLEKQIKNLWSNNG